MHAIVIGGGISGLAAAHRLVTSGARVTLVEGSAEWGGKLRSGAIAGVRSDLGAESMLARRPEGVRLVKEVGLGGALRPPAVAGAAVWTRDALRPMPQGHLMGVPASPGALAGVLSDAGVSRLAQDAELPPTPLGEDAPLGTYIAERMGDEVVDRMVEPLLGGVYAGDVHRLSMRATVPALYQAARREPSLLGAVRRAREETPPARTGEPVFTGLDGGLGTLPPALAARCHEAGATLLTDAAAVSLTRIPDAAAGTGAEVGGSGGAAGSGGPDELSGSGTRWRVQVDDGRQVTGDAVILAVPAAPAARLLASLAPAAARELAEIEYASVALVTLAFRREDLARLPRGSGFLVPAVDGRNIKAATFTSTKWDWAAAQDPGIFLLRASLGRYGQADVVDRDDDELTRLVLEDLAEANGLAAHPVDRVVTRWHAGLPQYMVGHEERVARIRGAAEELPGLRLCGAAYDGVGIPACIGGAWRAVRDLLATPVAGADQQDGRIAP